MAVGSPLILDKRTKVFLKPCLIISEWLILPHLGQKVALYDKIAS